MVLRVQHQLASKEEGEGWWYSDNDEVKIVFIKTTVFLEYIQPNKGSNKLDSGIEINDKWIY